MLDIPLKGLPCPNWNQGYASEGAQAALEFGFNELKLDEIVSFTTKTNLPSQKVMQKIGMKRDENGDFKHPKLSADHPLIDHVLYRKTKI